MTSERFLTFNEWKTAKAAGTLISHDNWKRNRDITGTLEDTFGPNPCNGLCFQNEETGERVYRLCDSPRCKDCGPRKAALLWHHLTTQFGDQAYIATVPAADYKKTTALIRQNRIRHGVDYQYAAVDLGDDTLLLVTNCPLDGAHRYQVSSIKKRFLSAYQTVRRALRKSWEIGSVTLSHWGSRKSVTEVWKAIFGKAREYDSEPWMDPSAAERARLKEEKRRARLSRDLWYRRHHGSDSRKSGKALPDPI